MFLLNSLILFFFFFFFQAEDGIRDLTVTGVQTCALPICGAGSEPPSEWPAPPCRGIDELGARRSFDGPPSETCNTPPSHHASASRRSRGPRAKRPGRSRGLAECHK